MFDRDQTTDCTILHDPGDAVLGRLAAAVTLPGIDLRRFHNSVPNMQHHLHCDNIEIGDFVVLDLGESFTRIFSLKNYIRPPQL